jgi:hypothetical protein
MSEGERNSMIEGIIYSFESFIGFLKQSNKGLLVGAIILIILTIYTVSNAYKSVSGFLGV